MKSCFFKIKSGTCINVHSEFYSAKCEGCNLWVEDISGDDDEERDTE